MKYPAKHKVVMEIIIESKFLTDNSLRKPRKLSEKLFNSELSILRFFKNLKLGAGTSNMFL